MGPCLSLISSTADEGARLDDVDLAFHVSPFDVLLAVGKDALDGGAGADQISGGNKRDHIVGGQGKDTIRAGNAGDRINLSLLDANTGTTSNNDAFTFIGSNAFSGAAGQLRAYQDGSRWFVEGDTDGDGEADFVLAVGTPPDTELNFGDFLP